MQILTFNSFFKDEKLWYVIETNKLWEDTWRCKETRKLVTCKRLDLFKWVEQKKITPMFGFTDYSL